MLIELVVASQLAVWLPPERTYRCDYASFGALADCRTEVTQRRMICESQADGSVRHCRVHRQRVA